ncbi:MAG TPA: lysophospholipase [Polyangiaceae bacterium]|nr:lysophospholipase [Polyangiaceae bacterium]
MPTRHEEGTLARRARPEPGSPPLYFSSDVPEGRTAAVVGLVHGYAEYAARYAHVIAAWAERGIATVTIDLRGHGHAGGPRGHCDRFADYLDDAAELVPLIGEAAPGAPAFLFGHSLGGLIAASVAITAPSPWRGVVLSAPFLGLALEVAVTTRLMGRVASRVLPRLGQRSGLRGADLTHDEARARAYDEDPLVFKSVTSRWFVETGKAQKRAMARAPSLTMPLYVVMGLDDRVADVRTARRFFEAAASGDKTWDGCEGLYHEVLNEPQWRPIADRLADWILARAR